MVTTFKGPLEAAGAVSPDASEEPAEELGASEDWGAALASPEEALFPVPPHAVKPKAAVMDNKNANNLFICQSPVSLNIRLIALNLCKASYYYTSLYIFCQFQKLSIVFLN